MSPRQGVAQTAALHLLVRGVTGAELARALGVTPQAISFQLSGKAAETSPALLDAIAEATDPETAAEVAQLIDNARRARKAEVQP